MTERDVLVTGSNRSGTTWVGEMLCHSGQLRYVHEPFNPGIWPRWLPSPLPFRNLYVCAENEGPYLAPMSDVLARRRPILRQTRDIRSPLDALRLARDSAQRAADRATGVATLLKDPIALFSAPWLADRFGVSVVVTIRNPAAFASSIQRLDWRFDFSNWLDQELLMRDLLGPFRREITAMVDHEHDTIDQAILLWRVHYDVVGRFREQHPDWQFVRWEDLARAPLEGFASLFASLGLRYDDTARERIAADNAAGNVREVARSDIGTIRRDSLATVDIWRHRLDRRDYERVRDGVGEIAERFYEPDEWALGIAP